MSDIVFIEDLRVQTVIGVFEWEREIRQTVSIDLEMAFDIGKAAASDDIADTVDYKALRDDIVEMVEASTFQLLEALAQTVADHVLAAGAQAVQVTIDKPLALRFADSVAVSIRRP